MAGYFPAKMTTETKALEWCIDASDQCVKCGLCLPHCPTYTLKYNEADSPRGRISLIRALATSDLIADKALVGHLSGCLQCQRCEAVCPTQVSFGRLMDTAKRFLFKLHAPSFAQIPYWIGWLLASRALRRFIRMKLYLYQRSGLRWLLRTSGILKILRLNTMDAMLPALSAKPLRSTADNSTASGERVALFTGCIAEIVDRDTLFASQRLLEAAGFAVTIPARQACCGALHQHAGDTVRAQRFIDQNTAAFASATPQTVVSCASGCGAQLKEHEKALNVRHFDVHTLLASHADTLDFHPLDKHVALHTPCTMDSCLNAADAVHTLLARIPQLKITVLPNSGCCGAAGTYMLTQPTTARKLLDNTLAPLARTHTDMLLSSNIGCIMHLRAGIANSAMNMEVMHPATLLCRQLRN